MVYGLSTPIGGISVQGEGVQATPFIIRELTGAKRTVVLRGRALPYRPERGGSAGWSGRQRTRLTWYQGNPVATQQVLGPEESGSEFDGAWKDRFLPGDVLVNDDPSAAVTAAQVVELLEDFRVCGNTIRVQWGHIVRVGVLVEFGYQWDRATDVRWKMSFEWSARDDSVRAPVASTTGAQASNQLMAAQNTLDDTLAFQPAEVPSGLPLDPAAVVADFEDRLGATTARLVAGITRTRGQVGSLFAALRVANTALSLPATIVGAVRSAVTSIRAETAEELSRLLDTPIPTWSGTTRAAQVFGVERWRRQMADAVFGVRTQAIVSQELVNQRYEPPLVQYFTANSDMTLYFVSTKFYGTPDFANFLVKANGLDSVLVPAGTELVIPPRPVGADGRP
jgi:hypothetical protein